MLAFLFDWTTRPEFVYSHAWQPGDALMWDNACTMHRRDPFDPKHPATDEAHDYSAAGRARSPVLGAR